MTAEAPTPAQVRQTQAERRETAERAILEAAAIIVAEKGVEGLTLNDVGEAAGYSRALPAHYFGTRSALLQALADHIMAGYAERLPPAGSGLQGLRDVIVYSVDDAIANPMAVRAYQAIVTGGLTHPDLRPTTDRITVQGIEDVARLIEQGRETGEIRADVNARAHAAIILASLRGVLFQWLTSPGHVSLSHMRDALVTSVCKSLSP